MTAKFHGEEQFPIEVWLLESCHTGTEVAGNTEKGFRYES